jgi:glycerol kinase
MPFQPDLIGALAVRPKIIGTTALGAAYLAGLAVGFWKNREEIANQWRAERRFEPVMPATRVRDLPGRWTQALERKELGNSLTREAFGLADLNPRDATLST